jgi:hypothetical protein
LGFIAAVLLVLAAIPEEIVPPEYGRGVPSHTGYTMGGGGGGQRSCRRS